MFFSIYFVHILKNYKSKSFLNTLILQMFIVLLSIIAISCHAVAKSSDSYCLSKVGEKQKRQENLTDNESPSNLSFPDDLPQLYDRPCTIFGRFFGDCMPVTYFPYSNTLDRVFVRGHRKTFLGEDFVSLEVTSNTVKLVPESIAIADFIDIPQWDGALFKTSFGQAFFYDGINITNLLEDFLEVESYKSFYFRKTKSGRIFLTSLGYSAQRGSPFLIELTTKLKLKQILLPLEVENTWLEVFTLPNSLRLWGITKNRIITGIEGELKTVVTIPESHMLDITNWESTDGSILFEVIDKNNFDLSTSFFIREAEPNVNCEIMLDMNKPILLDVELK